MTKNYQSPREPFFQLTSSRIYFKWVAGAFFIPLLLIMIINMSVDPFYFYRAPLISGFNSLKPSIGTNELWIKFNAISQYAPDAVVLGMSTARDGYDPLIPAWGPYRVMNLGIGASTVYQWAHFLPFIYSETDLKVAVVALNFLAFNASFESAARLQDGFDDTSWFQENGVRKLLKAASIYIRSTVTISALRSSYLTMSESRASLRRPSDMQNIKLNFQNGRELPATHEFRFLEMEQNIEKKHLAISGRPYAFSSDGIDSLASLKNLVAFAVDKRIKLILVIDPMHLRALRVIEKLGLWPLFEHWKRELAKVASQANVPLYDFATVSAVTTESVPSIQSPAQMKFWHEALHFSLATGDLVLSRVLREADRMRSPGEFGFALTPQAAESHLDLIRQQLSNYR